MSRARIYKEPEYVYFIKELGGYTGPYIHKRPVRDGQELVKFKIVKES